MQFLFCFPVAGQEENLYAQKNYDKYLSALQNSGLVSLEDKAQGATADAPVGAEGGAGAMVLLGKIITSFYLKHIVTSHLLAVRNHFKTVFKFFIMALPSPSPTLFDMARVL